VGYQPAHQTPIISINCVNPKVLKYSTNAFKRTIQT
jgi:hypothetical protein